MATASGGHEEVTAHNFHGSRVALSDRASSLHAARWVLLRPVAWRRDTADSLEKWNVPLSGGGVCDCCTPASCSAPPCPSLCPSLPIINGEAGWRKWPSLPLAQCLNDP